MRSLANAQRLVVVLRLLLTSSRVIYRVIQTHIIDIVFDMEWFLRRRLATFSCLDFGIDKQKFTQHTSALMQDASWDRYDLRLRRLEYLLTELPDQRAALETQYREYYLGGDQRLLSMFVDQLPVQKMHQFYQMTPFRKRSHARFILTYRHHQWQIVREPGRVAFSQGNHADLRSLPRIFQPMSSDVDHDDMIQRFLIFAAQTAQTRQPDITKLQIDMHYMAIHLFGSQQESNAPEGVHQDGSDYIVSALVIQRENVSGGTSMLYEQTNKETPVYHTTLRPGQGIFQEDQHSTLWHNVSTVSAQDPTQPAIRAILGLDINIL